VVRKQQDLMKIVRLRFSELPKQNFQLNFYQVDEYTIEIEMILETAIEKGNVTIFFKNPVFDQILIRSYTISHERIPFYYSYVENFILGITITGKLLLQEC